MAHSPSILCVGKDLDLLETRARLLERLGAEVKCATGVSDTLESVAREDFDLIVLCHSLKPSGAAAICDAVRAGNTPPLILQITKSCGFEEERAQIVCDAIVDAYPASLTDCARALLLKRSALAKSTRQDSALRDLNTFAAHQ